MNDFQSELTELQHQMGDLCVELFIAVAEDLSPDGHKAFDYIENYRTWGTAPPKGAPTSLLELVHYPFIHERSNLDAVTLAFGAIEGYYNGGDAVTVPEAGYRLAGLKRALRAVRAKKRL